MLSKSSYIGTIYDTSINIIGGLKDFSVISRILSEYYSDVASLDYIVKDRNEFYLRTDRSKIRVRNALRRSLLSFINQDHRDLLSVFKIDNLPQSDKNYLILWQFALNNRLIREITSEVFVPVCLSGRVTISKDDIIPFLKELVKSNTLNDFKWSESTINTLSTKYLNLMSKLGFLSAGKKKIFESLSPSTEAKTLFLYFAKIFESDIKNIFTNRFLPLSFIDKSDLLPIMKKLSLKGLVNINYDGEKLNFDLIHSYKGIGDVLYNRAQKEV